MLRQWETIESPPNRRDSFSQKEKVRQWPFEGELDRFGCIGSVAWARFSPWRSRGIRWESRFTTLADLLRFRSSPGGIFCGLLRMGRVQGLRPRGRPPVRGGDSGLALGRPGLPLALCAWNSAGAVRASGWTRRHGHWGESTLDRARADSRFGIRKQPTVCDLEYPGDR